MMTSDGLSLKQLLRSYRKIRPEIKKRIAQFRKIHDGADEKIFSELSYCILTANANAKHCDEAIKELEKTGLLLKGKSHQLKPVLRGRARFHNKKADFIVEARDLFKHGKSVEIKKRLEGLGYECLITRNNSLLSPNTMILYAKRKQ